MTQFKSGARYSGKIDNLIVVLLPSMHPGHHYVRLVSWNNDNPRVDVTPNPVFSDYVSTLLRQKGFDVDRAHWREYKDTTT